MVRLRVSEGVTLSPCFGGESMALKRMSIKVSEEMHDWLKVEADKRGLTMNAIIIFALENYYRQNEVIPTMEAMKVLIEQANQLQEQQTQAGGTTRI